MAGKVTLKGEIVRKLVAEFPDAPALTLAKRLYKEHPGLWTSLESCRMSVRRELGAVGGKERKHASRPRAPRQPGDWRQWIPDALVQSTWAAVEIAGPVKALVLADVHIPFHDPDAVALALQHGRDRQANLILLNGDILDHYALSRWETDPAQRDFPGEVRAGKQFLAGLRKSFPKARIVYKLGNHEERFERYLRLKAPELLGLPDITWASLFELEKHKIELVDGKRPIRLGKLNVVHGHEYVFQISNPVNPARGLFLRAKGHVLGSHFHQTSQHSERSLEQHVISAWSTGCLCDLHPEYRPLNNWNHGFAFVDVDKRGAFHVDNLRVIDGKAW